MRDFIKNLKYSWQFSRSSLRYIIGFIICSIASIIISVVVPILSSIIIVNLTTNELMQVVFITIILFLVESTRNIINYLSSFFSEVTYRDSLIKIQKKIGREILKIENKCLDSNSSGVFIERITNDTSNISSVFNDISFYLTEIITNIGIFVAILIICPPAFVFLFIMVLIIWIFDNIRVDILNKKDKEYRKKREKVAGFITELVRGVRDIKMLSAEKTFIKRFDNQVEDIINNLFLRNKTARMYGIIRGFLLDILDFSMILLLVYLISKDSLAIASALVIHNYMGKVTNIIYAFGSLLEKIKSFNLSSNRIIDIINDNGFSKEKFGSKHLTKVKGNFLFKNVYFKYSDNYVLKDLSFEIKANTTTAIVGKSGAGKSTIFNLICKMYDINEGSISIDGEDIYSLDRKSIRDNITIISQNPYIFNLSIRDNLMLVKENVSDDEIKEACHLACLDDFIESLPDGYDTIVGEGGISLSGGERQRLAIARALIQKTEIILFDEATSALDNETQKKIQEAINNMKKDYTIVIIAHRLSTIVNSDRILFLEDGKIASEGTHKELLKKCKSYKTLYDNEISK